MTQYQHPFNNPDTADGFGSMMSPRTSPHRGLDYAQPRGTPYGAAADGVVVDKQFSGVLGYFTVVKHADGMYTGYCHSDQPSHLNVGDSVLRGYEVNKIGLTGFTTGPHLHLTLSTVIYGVMYGQVQDPYAYIQARLTPEDVAVAPVVPQPTNAWSQSSDLRPAVTLRAPSGKIRISISVYGAGALVTYSIPGIRNRAEAITSMTAATGEIMLTDDPYGEGSASRTWIQEVPTNQDVTVQVECYGLRAGAFVASPSISVEVVY